MYYMSNVKSRFMLLLFFFFLMSPLGAFASEMKIHVIDYGDNGNFGDSVLIEQNGHFLLMDVSLGVTNKVGEYLDSHNVKKLDIYLSHYHADHYGYKLAGRPYYIEDIINKYDVGTVYVPDPEGNPRNASISVFNTIKKAADKRGCKLVKLKKGSKFNIGEAKAEVIYYTSKHDGNENHSSLATMITFGKTRYFTAGDSYFYPNENDMINSKIDVHADIMKLSHHASDTSSNRYEFITKVNPKYAFYQLGEEKRNQYGTWSRGRDVLTRVSRITNLYSMKYNGTIVFTINNDDITVEPTTNYRKLTIKYVDIDTNEVIKTKTYKYNDMVKSYLFDAEKTINNYSYVKEKNENVLKDYNNVKLTSDKEVKLYYKRTNVEIIDKVNTKIVNNNSRNYIVININNTASPFTYKELKSKVKGITQIKNKSNDNSIIVNGDSVVSPKAYDIILKGDINADGKISASDYIKIKKHILYIDTLNSTNDIMAADMDNDGKIKTSDYIKVRKIILGY